MGSPHQNDVPGTTSADPASKRTKGLYGVLAASSVGLEFGVAVVIGALFGNWLDGRFGTAPWLMIAFTIIGFVAGISRREARGQRSESRWLGGPEHRPRIERLNYVIGGIVVLVAAVTQPQSVGLGLAVGVALTCLNFFVLRRLVVKWTADAAAGQNRSRAVADDAEDDLADGRGRRIARVPADRSDGVHHRLLDLHLSIMIESLSSMMRTPPKAASTEEDHG